jgi:hypothetical protein
MTLRAPFAAIDFPEGRILLNLRACGDLFSWMLAIPDDQTIKAMS